MTANKTHDPALKSVLPYDADTDFPIQNLPFGVAHLSDGRNAICTRIGDWVVDLSVLEAGGVLDGTLLSGRQVFAQSELNAFMALGPEARREARTVLSSVLGDREETSSEQSALIDRAKIAVGDVTMRLPAEIPGYTDFYSSMHHAMNVGEIIRGKGNELMPNWTRLPVGYDGRASSVVVSGTEFHRPMGQSRPSPDADPVFGVCRRLDFEVEMGFFIGAGSAWGEPIHVGQATEHVFGLVVLNDWSARDIQAWEYQPLGPFLAKSFCTSISPWVVTLEALAPFSADRMPQDPEPFPYLKSDQATAYDIWLDVFLAPANGTETRIATTNYKWMYWTLEQQLAHHTSNGCNVRPGDLMGSGTISGPEKQNRGSLLELSWGGREPIALEGGESRTFIEDGDTVRIAGYCQGDGYRIGFGDVSGTVLPARV